VPASITFAVAAAPQVRLPYLPIRCHASRPPERPSTTHCPAPPRQRDAPWHGARLSADHLVAFSAAVVAKSRRCWRDGGRRSCTAAVAAVTAAAETALNCGKLKPAGAFAPSHGATINPRPSSPQSATTPQSFPSFIRSTASHDSSYHLLEPYNSHVLCAIRASESRASPWNHGWHWASWPFALQRMTSDVCGTHRVRVVGGCGRRGLGRYKC